MEKKPARSPATSTSPSEKPFAEKSQEEKDRIFREACALVVREWRAHGLLQIKPEDTPEDGERGGNEPALRDSPENTEVVSVFEKLSAAAGGPVADLLDEAGRRVISGEKPEVVADELYPIVEAHLQLYREIVGMLKRDMGGSTPRPPTSTPASETPLVWKSPEHKRRFLERVREDLKLTRSYPPKGRDPSQTNSPSRTRPEPKDE